MGGRGGGASRTVVAVVGIVVAAAAVLSSPAAAGGLGKEAMALLAIKAALRDPGQVLRGWDPKSGGHDPCRWSMVTCHEGHVHGAAEPLRHAVAGDREAQGYFLQQLEWFPANFSSMECLEVNKE
nr:unnamed protein product [Digitaria exilis]